MEQINAPDVGGIPGSDGGDNRPLALVACDEATDLSARPATWTGELRVPAGCRAHRRTSLFEIQPIIRDNDTAFFSLTVVADAVGAFDDSGLIFQMMLTDVQRAPLMNRQIGELEDQLRASRSRDAPGSARCTADGTACASADRRSAVGGGDRRGRDRIAGVARATAAGAPQSIQARRSDNEGPADSQGHPAAEIDRGHPARLGRPLLRRS